MIAVQVTEFALWVFRECRGAGTHGNLLAVESVIFDSFGDIVQDKICAVYSGCVADDAAIVWVPS